jgi:hypothetical protein
MINSTEIDINATKILAAKGKGLWAPRLSITGSSGVDTFLCTYISGSL